MIFVIRASFAIVSYVQTDWSLTLTPNSSTSLSHHPSTGKPKLFDRYTFRHFFATHMSNIILWAPTCFVYMQVPDRTLLMLIDNMGYIVECVCK
jgi:hypothetical protein